jgi:hypothetical protein
MPPLVIARMGGRPACLAVRCSRLVGASVRRSDYCGDGVAAGPSRTRDYPRRVAIQCVLAGGLVTGWDALPYRAYMDLLWNHDRARFNKRKLLSDCLGRDGQVQAGR